MVSSLIYDWRSKIAISRAIPNYPHIAFRERKNRRIANMCRLEIRGRTCPLCCGVEETRGGVACGEGGDRRMDRAMRQMHDAEAKVRDLRVGRCAPEAGAVGFFRRAIARQAGKSDAGPGDTVRAALEGDLPAPCTGEMHDDRSAVSAGDCCGDARRDNCGQSHINWTRPGPGVFTGECRPAARIDRWLGGCIARRKRGDGLSDSGANAGQSADGRCTVGQ